MPQTQNTLKNNKTAKIPWLFPGCGVHNFLSNVFLYEHNCNFLGGPFNLIINKSDPALSTEPLIR